MDAVQSINSDIAVADCQLSPEQIQQAAQQGFKAILNLRSPQEEGTLADEQAQVEAAGLTYANIPIIPSGIGDDVTDQVMQTIDLLPKPVLAHCKSGIRSGLMALVYAATRNNMGADAAVAKGKEAGFDADAYPQMKQFMVDYINRHTGADT